MPISKVEVERLKQENCFHARRIAELVAGRVKETAEQPKPSDVDMCLKIKNAIVAAVPSHPS